MGRNWLRLLCVAAAAVLLLGLAGGIARADVLEGCTFEGHAFSNGFGVPVCSSSDWETEMYPGGGTIYVMINREKVIVIAHELYMAGDDYYSVIYEDPDKARAYLESIKIDDWETEFTEILEHPAVIQTVKADDGWYAVLWYARNSALLQVSGYSQDTPVTMDDMKMIAREIQYRPEEAVFTAADTALSVSAKGDPVTVTAGKNVAFTAAFASPDRVNKKNKTDAVVWSVGKAGTGEPVEGVSIDARGQLKVDRSLAAPADLQVKVVSELFETSATYDITAMPEVSKVILEPAELVFYTGTEEAQTVKASLEPDTVPPVGLTWTPAKNIVEITGTENGVVSVKPLAGGKTTVAVKEPGGKNAKLTVSIVDPVESVELKANGAAKAGGRVTVTAALLPKTAGNKAVQWSIDVGDDIATINDKGQLAISRDAPSGTKITVTCTATGAPCRAILMDLT